MTNDLISIICTVKNGENTIAYTIDSVLEQTYEYWEFIIVEDGSNDSTNEIIDEYAKNDKRIKIIKTIGIGRGKALNKAIKNTNGKYICNIDADDLMHPDKLKEQIRLFKKNNDYFLLATKSNIIYDNELPEWNLKEGYNVDISVVGDKLLIKNQINHSSVMFNKQKLLSIGIYNQLRKSQYDYELWLRAYFNKEKMGVIEEEFVAKRIHVNQNFENKQRIRYLFESTKLQVYYIIKMKKTHLMVFPVMRFFLGLLPFKIRRAINKLTNIFIK